MKLADRLKNIEPSPTLAINALAHRLKAEGKDVVGFGAGEPDFDTPDFIKQAAIRALNTGDTKYTDVAGTAALRSAISAKLKNENGLDYPVSDIVVTTGGKQALYNLFMALLNPGDEVVFQAPYWVSYKDIVKLAEGIPVIIPTTAEGGYKLAPAQLDGAITPRTRAVIINSPSNPTGAVYTESELKALAQVLSKYPDIVIVTDDIYEKLIYDGLEFRNIPMIAPELFPRSVVVNGLSKAYSMTGWRLGYAAGPAPLIREMIKLQGQSTSNATSFAQAGAVAALTGDQGFISAMNAEFVRRRDRLVSALAQIPGIECPMPQGAFYVFPQITGLESGNRFRQLMADQGDSNPSRVFASYLLAEANVAVVPGVAFGDDHGFRMSYATSMGEIEKGISRIRDAVLKLSD